MSDLKLTVPAQLEVTPSIVGTLVRGLTRHQVDWKPAPERFSVAEVLAHLDHAERHAYRPKYRAFADERSPTLDYYDTDALFATGAYSNKDSNESLVSFEQLRGENLSLLRSLPAEYGLRTGHHRLVGPIRLSELISECAFHDLGHIRQIAELVRAQSYYPHMGLYAGYYKVNP